MITTKQYEELEFKYGKLMHKVSHWISGDNATASHDDNMQELWVVLLQTVETFGRIQGLTYEEFKDSAYWNKYIKTALWNSKNSRGAKITKKWPITRGTVNVMGNEEVLQMEDNSSPSMDTDVYLGELPNKLTEAQHNIVKLIVEDPNYLKPSGKANISALAQDTNQSWSDVSKLLQEIGGRINNDLN